MEEKVQREQPCDLQPELGEFAKLVLSPPRDRLSGALGGDHAWVGFLKEGVKGGCDRQVGFCPVARDEPDVQGHLHVLQQGHVVGEICSAKLGYQGQGRSGSQIVAALG